MLNRYKNLLDIVFLIGILTTYGLALVQAINIKKDVPSLTASANLLGSALGWAAVLISTGTFIGVMFAIDHYQRENAALRRKIEEMQQ